MDCRPGWDDDPRSVWSNPVWITVSGSPPEVTKVDVTRIEPQTVKVGEFVRIYATAHLSRPAPGGRECVVFVLAVGSKDKIVKRMIIKPYAGSNTASAQITFIFTQPGTYTVWVGAKYEMFYCY